VSFLQSTSFTFFDNITIGSEIPGGEGVPEPTTLALLGLGIAGIANQRRKRLAA
jgi:hypothetical protein